MKKLVIVFFSLAIVLGLSSCANSIDESDTLDANTTWEVINQATETFEPTTEELTVEPETELVVTEPVTTSALGQDLSVFEVNGEMEDGAICLKRNETLYFLKKDFRNRSGFISEYYCRTSGVDNGFFSVGEVPILKLMEGDKIIVYSSSKVPEISFVKVKDTGKWTLGADRVDNYYIDGIYFYNMKGEERTIDFIDFKKTNKEEFVVTDSNGNVCNDYYDVERGKEYIASWFVGTQYHETILNSNNHLYTFDEDSAIGVPWSLTKNGYAEYDWSGIPSGLYVLYLGTFWETIIVEIS